MLQADSCDLYKADIFALGASIYELASEDALPMEGAPYHALRDGSAPMPPILSPDAQALHPANPTTNTTTTTSTTATSTIRPRPQTLNHKP